MENTIRIINTIFLIITSFMASIGLDMSLYKLWVIIMCIDILTALIREVVISSQQEGRFSIKTVRSKVLIYGIASKLLLLLIPGTLGVQLAILGLDASFLIKTSIYLFSIADSYSIISNIQSTFMKKRLPEADTLNLITPTLTYLRRNLISVVENIMKGGYQGDK